MKRPAPPPHARRRRWRPHLAGLLVGAMVLAYAVEALGVIGAPFTHVRGAAVVILLLAVLAGGSSRWLRGPPRDLPWFRVVSALGLVGGVLALVALVAESPEALTLTVLACVVLVLLGAVHEAVAGEDRRPR